MIDSSNCTLELNLAKAFADLVGARAQLDMRLEYLGTYAYNSEGADLADALNAEPPKHTTCKLYADWSPYSFGFMMYTKDGKPWFNGGLIYHGPGCPGDGSAPSFCVDLAQNRPLHDWGVHT